MPEPTTHRESIAWLLTLAARTFAAVGEQELLHLIEMPTLLDVPASPGYCRQALLWNDRLLPALDLAAWLYDRPEPSPWTLAGVIACLPYPDAEPEFAALRLTAIPTRRSVTDPLACALPVQPAGWRNLAWACFRCDGQPTPILDLAHILSGGLLAANK